MSFNVTGSADNGSDYNQSPAFPTSITFPAGETSVTVDLLPETDSVFSEDDETVIVTLAASSTYDIGPANEATVTIHPAHNEPPTVDRAIGFGWEGAGIGFSLQAIAPENADFTIRSRCQQ